MGKFCVRATETIDMANASSLAAFAEEQSTMHEQTTMVPQIRNSQYRHPYHYISIPLKINIALSNFTHSLPKDIRQKIMS